MRTLASCFIVAGALACGCGTSSPDVPCANDLDCNLGAGGQCALNGPTGNSWCSYPDTTCPGGRRWSDYGTGDGLSGECIDSPDAGTPDATIDAVPDADLPDADPDGGTPLCPPLVVFTDTENDKREVYVSNVDGSGLINISQSATANDTDPNWSPARDRIVFSSDRTGNWDIFLAAANGEWRRNLTEGSTTPDLAAAWSPDGTKVAFERNQQLWLMNADGSSPLPLVTSLRVSGVGRTIKWSPDGNKILFSAFPSNSPDIYVVDSAGATQPVNLTNTRDFAETSASWSPDGRTILYSNYLDVFVIAPDGTNGRTVTGATAAEAYPAWMPDGLAFIFTGRATRNQVFRLSLAGGDPAELTTGDGQGDLAADVAHDGSLIAFTRESSDRVFRDVGIAGADGSNPVFFSAGHRKVLPPRFAPACR